MAVADYRLMTEATGQRIAAALEALHLATVTGVKGDTEQNYRHGDVNLTPANIGAVAKSGDTMTGTLSVNRTSDGGEADVEAKSAAGTIYLYSTGSNTGNKGIYVVSAVGIGKSAITIDQNNNITCNGNAVNVTGTVQVDHGGTGATQATIDITDFCTFPTGNVATSGIFGGRLYYNPYLNCVFGTIIMDDNASISNGTAIVYLKKDSSGTPLIANRAAACGVCVHSEATPVIVHIQNDLIISSHTNGDTINTPRYTIMAFLG